MRVKLEREMAESDRKLSRLLRMVEDGNADPAATGPRVNELAAEKRRLAEQLALRPQERPRIAVWDGGASYRKPVSDLRAQLADGTQGTGEATQLVRALVRRITVLPGADGDSQPIEIEARSSMNASRTDQCCEVGCGGSIKLSQYWPRIVLRA
jgi:hypothetical protein